MERIILANMCMIYNDKNEVLVINRRKKVWPGIAFPGGHVEKKESIVLSTIREVKEETGLDITNLEIAGVKDWFNEKENYRYIVFLFKTNKYSGNLINSIEGEVFWVKLNDISDYDLASGFDDTLKVFLNKELSELYYELNNDIRLL